MVDHVAVHRILAEHGIHRYPDALMLVQPEDVAVPKGTPWGRKSQQSPTRLRKGRALSYFSEPYYRLANPDLRDLDLSMVLHWQVHGRLEGRPPHPFIDLDWLSTQITDSLPGEVLDVYLTDRTRWLTSPGPYVETEAFVVSGPWDGVTHPFLQIIRDYPVDPWLRGRLGVIDLADADGDLQLAAGVLTARNPGLARLSSFSVFEAGGEAPRTPVGHGLFRVVPGFVLAADSRLIWTVDDEVLSADGTALRLDGRVVVLDARDSVTCASLVFVTSPLAEATVERLARDATADTLVAPYDAAQQTSLERLGVQTLALGRQLTVDAASVELVGEPR
jgi:hypothetical protein